MTTTPGTVAAMSPPAPTGQYGRELRQLLAGIGAPPPAPFQPDQFQTDALQTMEFQDVLVTAPTGSGKTWIAREEIRRLLAEGRKAWYTTPLKALTNSKYQEFSDEFGAANVGIRPSFDPPKELLEPHFFDLSGDLYGQEIEVALHSFLRPEAKFDSLDALTAQIARDCDEARARLAALAL